MKYMSMMLKDQLHLQFFKCIKYVKHCRQRAVLCSLRRYFKYLCRDNLYTATQGIHAYRHKRIIPTLTEDDQVSIKETMNSHTVFYRNTAIVLLGISTGIRACELINLKLSDIDWINDIFCTEQNREYCMHSACYCDCECIANYLIKERPKADNSYLFVRQLAPFER
jgi:integrase